MEISGSAAPTAGPGAGITASAVKDARTRYSRPASEQSGKTARSTGKSIAGYESIPRARLWSEEVEDLYRLQYAGWRDETEYKEAYGQLPRHAEAPHFISTTRLKSNGFYVYWRKYRELDDKHVGRVKLYGMGASPEKVEAVAAA